MPLSDADKELMTDELTAVRANQWRHTDYVNIGMGVLYVLAALQLTVLVLLIFLGWWPLIAAVPVLAWAMIQAAWAVRQDRVLRNFYTIEATLISRALAIG